MFQAHTTTKGGLSLESKGFLDSFPIPYINIDSLNPDTLISVIEPLITKVEIVEDTLIIYNKFSGKYYAIEIFYRGENWVQLGDYLQINLDDLNLFNSYNGEYSDYSSVITADDFMLDGDDAIWIESQSEYYSIDSEELFRCDNCLDYHHINDRNVDHTGLEICNPCYEDSYTYCDNCDSLTHCNELYHCEAHDTYVCEVCYHSECGEAVNGVHSYEYKPTPIFYGDDKGPKFGFEIECNFGELQEAVDDLNECEAIYLKEDSSVNGIEIVTHPMTVKYLSDNILPTLQYCAKEYNGVGHNVGGIHIHIGRNSFKSDKQFSIFYDLINDNLEFTELIAQRNISQWSKINPYKGKKSLKDTGNYNDIGRYSAVNINNLHTIEVRIFNSNLRPERILKNAEYITALLDYSAMFKSNKIEHFIAYIKQCPELYPNLVDFLSEKGV